MALTEANNNYRDKHHTTWFTYFTIAAVNIYGFSYGLTTSWSSPMLLKLVTGDTLLGYAITTEEASWITSLMSFGAIFSPIPIGYAGNYFGRKPVLFAVGFLMSTAFFLLAFSRVLYLHYLARFLMGISNGSTIPLIGMFLIETCHYKEKPLIIASVLGAVTLGSFVPYLLGPYVSYQVFNLICGIFPTVFAAFVIFVLHETPAYLTIKGKSEAALIVLRKYRRKTSIESIQKELKNLEVFVEEHKNRGSIFDLFRDSTLLKCLSLSILLVSMQHFSGAVPISAFKQLIFEEAGGYITSDVSSIIVACTQFAATFPAPLLLKHFKYRPLLFFSAAGMAASLTVLGLYFYLATNTSDFWFVPILAMIATLLAYIYGVAVIPHIMVVELFPTNVRPLALALCASFGSLESFLVTRYFLIFAEAVGIAWGFWFFALVGVVSALIVVAVVPETNGKSFLEIQEMLRKKGRECD